MGSIAQTYGAIKKALIPTEHAANVILIVILIMTIVVLVRGNSVTKAAWAAWMILP